MSSRIELARHLVRGAALVCAFGAGAFGRVVDLPIETGHNHFHGADGSNRSIFVVVAEAEASRDVVEQFKRGLVEVNKNMPFRMMRGLQLDLTNQFRPFLADCTTVQDALDMFAKLGLSAHRDKNAAHLYYTYAYVEFVRLATEGGLHFRPGDRLAIGYSSKRPDGDAEIMDFSVTLLNDHYL